MRAGAWLVRDRGGRPCLAFSKGAGGNRPCNRVQRAVAVVGPVPDLVEDRKQQARDPDPQTGQGGRPAVRTTSPRDHGCQVVNGIPAFAGVRVSRGGGSQA